MKDVEDLLSNRLLMVARLVKPCESIYDIGTDHCYLPIYMIQKGIIKRAVATDVKKGPVQIALRNINIFGLDTYIDVFVSDGISHVGQDSNIIISGMGADVIIEILTEGIHYAKNANQIIIQCQSKTERLRSFLWDNGFYIEEEALCKEKDKVYNAFRVSYCGVKQIYTEIETIASKKLVKMHHPLLTDYISCHIRKLEDIISGYKASNVVFSNEEELKRALEEINENN
ncbi:MAG TPA: class I SAM-dependent methyltransferase [Clostridia bacterium]|nr:MAG: tRNA (adenine(22)-N(1))-methyltransferase [Firmicutes bacterium ADurb.Bin146]HOD92586.1 class I SAM-dependent methyltransferase [Clostridia bacterium]HQM39948.1 class I SAM-dependent methyltransferase [Clostridia bacterium]